MALSYRYSALKVTIHQLPKTACKILKIHSIQKKMDGNPPNLGQLSLANRM
jgi:hypothetical protein